MWCGPACSATEVAFNNVYGSASRVFSAPITSNYSVDINKVCDVGMIQCPSLLGYGPMPSQYKGKSSFSNEWGSGTLTYCYEPAMAGVTVGKSGDTYTLTMPIWGFLYEWEVSRGAEEPRPLTIVGNGTDVLQSSSITVTPAMLEAIYGGNVYVGNFKFRVYVTGCYRRPSEFSEAITPVAPKPVVEALDTTPVTCFGGSDGTVTLSISSETVNNFYINCYNRSTPPKSFVVPDLNSENTAPVHRGTYTIKGLDAGDWEFEVVNNSSTVASGWASKTVKQNPKVTVDFSKTPPANNGYYIRCSGGTGDVTAIGGGGSGGYKDFTWNTGATTATLSGIAADTYTVRVYDRYNCPSDNTPVTLSAPAPVSVTVSSPKAYNGYEVRCHDQANGSATASVSGGVTTSQYTYMWSTGASTAVASGLGTGTHTVTVSDINGCSAPGSVLLTAPPAIDFSIDMLQGLTCAGDRTAMLEAKPVLSTIIGTAAYAWSTGERVSTAMDKGAGTYSITVSDGQGCSTTKSRVLADPPGYTVSLASGADYNGSPIKCTGDFNGKLVSTVRDAANVVTTAQSYQWLKNGVPFADGAGLVSQEDLSKGTYRLVITYGAQCKAEAQLTLYDPDVVTVTASITSNYHGQEIGCHNGTDGKVLASVTGGTGDYHYAWDTGSTDALLTGLGAGIYTVVVEDDNGCSDSDIVELSNPTAVVASIIDVSDFSGYGVSCATSTNGTMTAVGLGGTGNYTYSWSNGRASAINATLGGGLYTVTVSDENSCEAKASQEILVPSVLTAGVDSYSDISCNGGHDGVIRLLPGGGVGNYTYSLTDGTTWGTHAEFAGLTIGTYALRVRDGNDCEAPVKQKLEEPSALALTIEDVSPAFCADPRGTAKAVVKGGVMDYTYRWTNASGTEVGIDEQLLNARGGLYTVTVHDAHHCEIVGRVGITSTDGAKATYTAVSALCHDSADGSATLTITEGDEPISIEWPDGQTGLQANNLKGGDYLVVITDGHYCAVVEEIIVPAPAALALTVGAFTAPTCHGDCDGALTLASNGGTGTHQYFWNGRQSISQANLCQGTYAVVLTDDNGCVLNQSVTLAEPDVLAVNLERATLATCNDGCDGRLEVRAAGGNGGYVYSWDGGVTGPIHTNLCPDDYGVMVTDAKGCLGSRIVTLPNTPPVAVDLGGGVTLCVGQAYMLNAGTGWTTIQWRGSTGLQAKSQQVTVKDAGTYWLDVVDEKGCVGQDTFLLETSYDLLNASFMIPKEAVAGDTVVMVDVSWPLPEVVEWDFPLTMTRVSERADVVFGQFNATGTYTVVLTAHLGECLDHIEKNIVVTGGGESNTGGRLGYEAYVKKFSLYANPNDGAFDVTVELASADDILLSIWGAQTGTFVGKVSGKGSASYTMHVDLRPLSAGTYVIRLDHARGSNYLRFVVM